MAFKAYLGFGACKLGVAAGTPAALVCYRDGHPLTPPGQGFFVGGEEDVDVMALDRAAAIDHFDGLAVVVTGDQELGSEGEKSGVGGDEDAGVVADRAAAGGQADGVGAAAFFAGAIGRHFHPEEMG